MFEYIMAFYVPAVQLTIITDLFAMMRNSKQTICNTPAREVSIYL